MPGMTLFSQFFVKINGADVSQEFMDDVLEIRVDSSLYLPDMFTIVIQDDDLAWVDDTSLLKLGATVDISAQPSEMLDGGGNISLFKGEITGIEPDFSATGRTTTLIRGYDKSHRLHRGKQTRTFLKQTDAAIVQKIAGEVGLTPQADNPGITYEYVLQNNQTNMEFLQSRAERLGYKLFAAEGKLYFKKGEAVLGSGPTLTFGENLRTFRPILAATHQADQIQVMGWDPTKKEVIKSQVTPKSALNQGGISQTGGAAAKSAFSQAKAVTVTRPIATVDEAKALATGLADDLSGEFLQAEGVSLGEPGVKAGYTITIENVGNRFSGKYFVTSAIHSWSRDGYETHFTISGRQPNTISHLVESDHNGKGRGLMQGVVVGLVTNNEDKDGLDRVKVKYPWLGDDIESDWIRVAAPGGGKERGFHYLPEINDEVLLAFEHGDPHRPYILGGLWNTKDKPPPASGGKLVSSGKVNQRIIQSRTGHILILDDTQGKGKIYTKTTAGHQVVLDDKSGSENILIQDKSNNNKITIDTTKNTVTIEAAQDVVVQAKNNMTLKCNNQMTLQCTNLDIKANAAGKITANASLKLNGGPMLDMQGLTAKLSGGTMVQVQGALVKIN